MNNSINWGLITDGVTFQSLVAKLISFQDFNAHLFDRKGKDAGQDIRSGDGATVYQAKYRENNSFDVVCEIALEELTKIVRYRRGAGYEHECWNGITNWIIVSNFRINPNDERKWETIRTAFQTEGLDANYWNLLKIEAELDRFPVIKEEYFSGKNRVFLSIIEAEAALKKEAQFKDTLEISYFVQKEPSERIDKFLNSEKQILPIYGEGGVGKTRFLLESAKKAAENGYQVLWANVETMTYSSEWSKAINPSIPTLIIIDEPESVSLIRKIFEFIRTDRWKAMIALRPAKESIINEMKLHQASYLDSEIKLFPLSSKDAKQFCELFLKNANIQITDPPQDVFINALVAHTSGNPIWMSIALGNIAKNKDNAIMNDINTIAQKYIDEVIREMHSVYSEKSLQSIFFYLALFRRVNIDDRDDCDYIYKKAELPKDQDVIEIFQALAERRFLINYGINHRFFSIKPDVIRDYILTTKLLSSTTPIRLSRLGDIIVGELLDNNGIPHFEDILSSLVRTDMQNHTTLLTQRIFEVIGQGLEKKKTIETQAAAIEFLEKLQFCDPERAVDIYKNIWQTAYPPSEQNNKLLGYFPITHEQLKRQVVWQLYNIAKTLRMPKFQGVSNVIFDLLCSTYLEEFSCQHLPNDGKNAKDLIPKLIKAEKDILLFSNSAMQKLHAILSGSDFSTMTLALLKCIADAYLNIEREDNYFTDDSLHIVSYILPPTNSLRQDGEKVLAEIKELIWQEIPTDLSKCLIEILSAAYHNRNRLQVKKGMDDSEIDSWKAVQLRWVKTVLEKGTISDYKCKIAMREIWKWDLKYGKGDSQSLANECEELFAQDKNLYLIQQLCDCANHKNYDLYAGEIIGLYEKRLIDLVSALKCVQKSCRDNLLHNIPRYVAQVYFNSSEIPLQVSALLRSEDEETRKFGVKIASNVLNILQDNEDPKYEHLWEQFYILLADKYKYELFLELYSDGHPFRRTFFSTFNWEQLTQHYGVFPNKFQLFRCVASLGFLDWKRTIEFLEEQWTLINDIQEQQICLQHFIDYLNLYYSVAIHQNPETKISNVPIDFIFRHVGDVSDPNPLFDYELESLVHNSNLQPFSWFIDFLNKRMNLENNHKSVRKFRSSACDFSVRFLPKRFVTYFNTLFAVLIRIAQKSFKSLWVTDISRHPNREEHQNFNVLPYKFSPQKWVSLANVTILEWAEFLSICEKSTSINYDLPRMIFELDPDGILSLSVIQDKLQYYARKKEITLVIKWEGLIAFYPVNKTIWRECTRIILDYAHTLPHSERNLLYGGLIAPSREAFFCPKDEVPPISLEKLRFAEDNLGKETEDIFKDYWLYLKQAAEAEIEWQKGHIQEREP